MNEAIGASEDAVTPETSAAEAPRRGRWLTLAFVGLLSLLILISTTGVGAAASRLIFFDPYACGGP